MSSLALGLAIKILKEWGKQAWTFKNSLMNIRGKIYNFKKELNWERFRRWLGQVTFCKNSVTQIRLHENISNSKS